MDFRLANRKIVSALKVGLQRWNVAVLRLSNELLGINVRIGRNAIVGRRVKVEAFDGGEIFLGDSVYISDNVVLQAKGGKIVIGDNTFIGVGCQFVSVGLLQIGSSCLIASYTVINDSNHGTLRGALISSQPHRVAPVFIGNDVWLGSHTVVVAGSRIGDGAVLGAVSVVNSNIPSYSIAVGAPAKPISVRS